MMHFRVRGRNLQASSCALLENDTFDEGVVIIARASKLAALYPLVNPCSPCRTPCQSLVSDTKFLHGNSFARISRSLTVNGSIKDIILPFNLNNNDRIFSLSNKERFWVAIWRKFSSLLKNFRMLVVRKMSLSSFRMSFCVSRPFRPFSAS